LAFLAKRTNGERTNGERTNGTVLVGQRFALPTGDRSHVDGRR
jgi:hypothetical protein